MCAPVVFYVVQELPDVRPKKNPSSAEHQGWVKGGDVGYGAGVYGDGPLNVVRLSQPYGWGMAGGADSSILLRHPAQQNLDLEILVGGDCNVGRTGGTEGAALRWHVPAVFYGVQELLEVHEASSSGVYGRSAAKNIEGWLEMEMAYTVMAHRT